nr:hypothetical protein [uncultured Sphingomonas sp.]
MIARIQEELRKQGATRGFLVLFAAIFLALLALLFWMAASAIVELDRNAAPRDLSPWKVESKPRNESSNVPYDPMRHPAARIPDGVADFTAGGQTIRMRYQWIEKPALRMIRPEEAEGRDRGQTASDRDPGADRLSPESAGKAEPYQPKGYQPHCQNPKSQGDSDLCAQWLAAREAASANSIGRSGLVLQWLNLIVTLFVGAMTAIGLLVAAQATRLAAQAMDTANRVVRGQIVSIIRPSGVASAGKVRVRVENIGESPAEIVGHKWFTAASVDVAESNIPTAVLDFDSIYLAAGEKDFCGNLDDEPAIGVVIDYTDMLDGRWRCWAVFERVGSGKYLRRKHGEKRQA